MLSGCLVDGIEVKSDLDTVPINSRKILQLLHYCNGSQVTQGAFPWRRHNKTPPDRFRPDGVLLCSGYYLVTAIVRTVVGSALNDAFPA